MAIINVTFRHPSTGATASVEVDDSMTCQEVVDQLIKGNFLNTGDYGLAIYKGGELHSLASGETLATVGVLNDTKVVVVPNTDAGGSHG